MTVKELFEAIVELRKKNDEGGDYPYNPAYTIRAIELIVYADRKDMCPGVALRSERLVRGENEKENYLSIFIPKHRIPAHVWEALTTCTDNSWWFVLYENKITEIL